MEFKVGDKVRVIVDDHGVFKKGHEFVVKRVGEGGGVYDKRDICVLKHRVELVTPKQSKKQRITILEKLIEELKERIEALEEAEKQRYVVRDTNNYNIVVKTNASAKLKPEVHKTPNQQRKEIIEKAKQFVEVNSVGYHFDAPNINKRCGWPSTLIVNFGTSDELQFIEVKEKRKVVALIRDMNDRKVYHKGIAKCSQTDVFNVHIGKAIALGRALGKDVSEFENAVQPNPARGQKILLLGSGSEREISHKHTSEGYENAWIQTNHHFSYEHEFKIIDDTNAVYEVEK